MAGRSGVLFDVDGTLLDTNYLHTVAWWRALRDAGHGDIEMVQVHQAIGIASEGLLERLIGHADERIIEGHTRQYAKFQDDVTAFARAAELIRACRKLGLTVVLATSGAKDDLEWMLPAIGVAEDEIDGAVTSSDVKAAKPHPDLLQVAMREHDLDPERTVVVGDTVWDVEAAERAGIACVALECGGIDEAQLRAKGAAEVYPDPGALVDALGESLLGRMAG